MAGKSSKSIKKKEEYYQVTNGEWVPIPWRGFKDQCCHCGLVHRTNFRIKNGKLQFQAFVDGKATGGARTRFRDTEYDDEQDY